jgi:hypothetical protein
MDTDGHTQLKDGIGKPAGAEPEGQRLDLRGKSVAEIVSILTSPPIACEDGIADPPAYAAPIAPQSPPIGSEPPQPTDDTLRIANAPPMAPGIGGPNLDLQPSESRPFEGGAAVPVLEHHASHTLRLREPPIETGQPAVVARLGRLPLLLTLAATIAVGVTLMMVFNEARKRSADVTGMVTSLFEDPSRARTPTKAPRLSVKAQKGLVNEPLSLGVSLNRASGGEKVILAGLATGTTLSAGTPLGLTGWQMLAGDLDNALVYAPKDFVGTMVAAIDLRSLGDWLMDSEIVRLEWIQRKDERVAFPPDQSKQTPTTHTLNAEEVATLFKHFLDTGDIMSPRLLLRQAASTGNAQAALELGMTFDPVFLEKWGAVGFAPNVAQAREWYKRASELGSTEASRRLEQLTGVESDQSTGTR